MPDPTGRISHVPEMHRGEAWKQPCRVATTANITIASDLNAGDTIDGVVLVAGDRVLVKNQSTGSQNGIYVAGASPARAFDMDQDGTTTVPAEEIAGAFVWVLAGTVNGQTLWHSTNTSGGTLGSTSIVWTQFTSSGSTTSTPFDHGSMGAAETFDLADGDWHRGTLTANLTTTVTGFTVDEGAVMLLELTQDGTGGWDITWDADVDFGDGDDQPEQAIGAVTFFVLWSSAGNSTIYGAKVGGGASLSDDTPLIESGAGDPGVSTSASRSDHVHPEFGGSDPADDTHVWMPLTTVDGGEPVLVWDGDDSLIPDLVPLA